MAIDIPISFLLIGATIFVGFLGSVFFERTKISELLILVVLGALIGPILGLVDQALFTSLIPFFAALALLILLFDGGLNLNFYKVAYELPRAFVFTILAFIISVFVIGFVASWAMGWSFELGLLLGVVVGGSSSEIVISLVNKIRARDEVKTMLKLESAITDALCIVAAIALAQIIVASSFNLSNSVNSLAGGFSIAAIIGIVAGLIWLNFWNTLKVSSIICLHLQRRL